MKKTIWVFAALVGVQLVSSLLVNVDAAGPLIWWLVQAIYHLPLSWMGEPLFRATELGPYPTLFGRLVTTSIYVAIVAIIHIAVGRNSNP